ncbi:MAG: type 1 glutamine amidotransferase [Halococcoides sp.]
MADPRIAVLNAADTGTHTSRNFRRELPGEILEYQATDRELPAIDGIDGCVVTGSRASVYWDEPWIDPLADWIADAVASGCPTLGVCFGHQIVAEALGGTVEPIGEYEIGYRTVDRVGDADVLAGLDREFLVFTTHSDRVTELPPGARPIARNDYGNHGFACGSARTVQFHPEYDTRTAALVTRQKDELPAAKRQAALDSITRANYERARQATRVFENFADRVIGGPAAGAACGTADD